MKRFTTSLSKRPAVHGLRIEMSDEPRFHDVTEFYVRLRMKAGGYKEIHRALSGIVNKFRVEAASTVSTPSRP